MSAPITQKSKIHLRQGYQSDIPGAPTSLSPLTFAAGLDSGEMAYTVDTGRIFIGGTSGNNSPAYLRTVFPYQNVEVLTEASPLLSMLIQQNKTISGGNSFIQASLPASNNFINVTTNVSSIIPNSQYDGISVGETGFIIPGNTLNIKIDYFLFEGNNPFASGTLRAMSVPNNNQAFLNDQRVNVNNSAPNIQFQFLLSGNGPQGSFYSFQYISADLNTVTMYFQILNPLG